MLGSDADDHRRASEAELVRALRSGDGLALAETYHRTVPGVHAVARRLVTGSVEIEALLRRVYGELWAHPPAEGPLEGWLRARAFTIGAEHLRDRSLAPSSPSLGALLPDLPRAEPRYFDAAEDALADLDERDRLVLLQAHDAGQPASSQGAGEALDRALLALAGPDPSGGRIPKGQLGPLGDYVLGLLPSAEADALSARVAASPADGALVRALRRGRRALEGLPPAPDLGQRVLVAVVTAAASGRIAPAVGPQEATDAEAQAPPGQEVRADTGSSALDERPEPPSSFDDDVAVPSGAMAVAPDAADVDLLDEVPPEEPPAADPTTLPSALDDDGASALDDDAVDEGDDGGWGPPQVGEHHEEPFEDAHTATALDLDDAAADDHDTGARATEHLGEEDSGHRVDEDEAATTSALDVPDDARVGGPASEEELVDAEHFGEEDDHPGLGTRLLRLLGYALLLVLGVLAGLFLGQLIVNLL